MTSDEEKASLRHFQRIPNVGPAFARDLFQLGFRRSAELKGQKPEHLYNKLRQITGVEQDPCVLDTFRAVVHYVETGEAKKWWEFTPLRKAGRVSKAEKK
jgi:hypothetical protein